MSSSIPVIVELKVRQFFKKKLKRKTHLREAVDKDRAQREPLHGLVAVPERDVCSKNNKVKGQIKKTCSKK